MPRRSVGSIANKSGGSFEPPFISHIIVNRPNESQDSLTAQTRRAGPRQAVKVLCFRRGIAAVAASPFLYKNLEQIAASDVQYW
jgi:hypothetical protein